MAAFEYFIILLITSTIHAAAVNKELHSISKNGNDDLDAASSSYSHQYSNWGGNSPGGYGYSVTGFGIIDDKINSNPAYKRFDDNLPKSNVYAGNNNLGYGDDGYGAYKGFDPKLGVNSGYNPSRVPGGYSAGSYGGNGFGANGYGRSGYGASGYGSSGYGASGYGVSGLGTSGQDASGYGSIGYSGGSGYNPNGYGVSGLTPGYEGNGLIRNGGYGGFGGNGGLASYSGSNNPLYKGSGHLGYGYYNKGGYGNIYSSGVTPNLVTGYRGYTRR